MKFPGVIGYFLAAFLLLARGVAFSQETAAIYGRVTGPDNAPLELVNVSILGQTGGTVTGKNGTFDLKVPASQRLTVVFSFIGYYREQVNVTLAPGERRNINKTLRPSTTNLPDFVVSESQINRTTSFTRIDPRISTFIPSPAGGIEAIIKTMPGVSSQNELSSQYNVRGGNYDENLVYVGDVEIYRPFLIRSGQQEGLSFLNSDLISSVLFSAGGFEARYGDKMSSVLEIQYKRPREFGGSASLSLLGGSAHIEGASPNKKWTFLTGIRQKSNQYVLKGMETKGEYHPSFTDVQTYITWAAGKKLEISFLGNVARNTYSLVPQDRETAFGTWNTAYKFKVYFDGREKDKFESYLGAVTAAYQLNPGLRLKLIASAFQTDETETYDIQGQYWIGKLESSFGSSDFGQVVEAMGVGTYLNHARNYLTASVYNLEHRGSLEKPGLYFQYGLKYQREIIHDQLSEWTMRDSAGYSLPYVPDSLGYTDPGVQPYHNLEMNDVVRASNDISSNRYTGFLQNTWNISDDSNNISLTAGMRFQYWDFNSQFLGSPRINLSIKPKWKNDMVFRFATGLYYQPPFYRELRDFSGRLNHNLKAQTSIHFVAGSDWNFKAWHRPFKFVSEVYYKYLDNLVPYVIDNVRIRYYANNSAHGYALGIDTKVNGEFVRGIESWASLSVMQTREDIEGDYFYKYYNKEGKRIIVGITEDQVVADSIRVEPGFIPRPTDQRINFSLFFQDYLPMNPTYKMHLTLTYGSGLPFGPPNSPKYADTLRIPAYRRVDIGFSKQLKGEESRFAKGNLLNYFKSIWISLEVFNLLQIDNTISYIWVKDIADREYAIPNYLTPRQLNLKLVAQF